jgi:molybdopterin-guanine dinucleotide biosynthesis protein A
MAARPAVSGAVLAGGRARRMGADKRWVTLDGVPLLAHAVAPSPPSPTRSRW